MAVTPKIWRERAIWVPSGIKNVILYDAAWSLFTFLKIFLVKNPSEVSFVSTKLASKRAIKLGGSNSRRYFQSFGIKSISRIVSRARAQHEIAPKRNASFPSQKRLDNRSLVLDRSSVNTKSMLVIRGTKIILYTSIFHSIFGPRGSSSSSVLFLATYVVS